ncbi:LytTR family transcriptional regulator DNA-binding domain-containing protein [Winogradskyella sp. 3972H.M.0a.05]|uniref:LytR/AlgR family response regulator transcription factor n=1 Tax=Winogradskyella sp. 3972H.M.0a.05 TaxID=2950277 RepID=UPI003396C0D3
MSRLKSKYVYIVLAFVLANILIGRLFQESLELVCQSELLIIGGTSFLFFYAIKPILERASKQWNPLQSKKNMLIQAGLGISVTGINILISQVAIIFAMIYVYNCTSSPSFTFLNASLTNNLALNLFCYALLILMLVESHRTQTSATNDTMAPVEQPTTSLVLSSHNRQNIVNTVDISFIEVSNNCIIFNTTKGKFVKYQSLKSFLSEHNLPQFKRIHRSYAVNSDCIESIQKNTSGDGYVYLNDQSKLKFSRSFKDQLLN